MCFSLFTAAPSGPPLNFAVQVTAVTSLTFSWSPPEVMLQNGAITSYKLACTGDTDVSYTTSQLQFTIDTFVPAATFQCSVLATNEFGDGPPTGVLTVATECKHYNIMAQVKVYNFSQMYSLELRHICRWLILGGTFQQCCPPVMRESLLPFPYQGPDSHSGVPADRLSM